MFKNKKIIEELKREKYLYSTLKVYKEETDDLESTVEEASFLMKRNKDSFRESHTEIYLDKYKVKQIIK